MTGSSTILDTNVVIELFKGNSVITAVLENQKTITIPFVVLGELYLGAYRSSNPKKHTQQINTFLNNCNVLLADRVTSDYYAYIKSALLKKGKPIPENDIWIAAIAKQNDLTLATRDRHFEEIDGLDIEKW